MDVYVERGAKRTFAGALDWPGWCRRGTDEETALDALVAAAPRYAKVVGRSRLGFKAPRDLSELTVVQRVKGDAGTDFGVPGMEPAADREPVDDAELKRLGTILQACWRAFDRTVDGAKGKTLEKGPRGGGRDLAKIAEHVREAEDAYLRQLGRKPQAGDDVAAMRREALDALAASARGEIGRRGPRGGLRWSPRYFVRRAAWHVLDHAWEIEDRSR